MKLTFVLTIIVFSSLVGCQIDSRTQSSSPAEIEEAETGSIAESSLGVTGTIDAPTVMIVTMAPEQADSANGQGENMANANVLFVEARLVGDGSWAFTVTVEHADTGWEDYADGWDVVLPDGTVVKPDPESPFTRLLLHPHENEQPFTRSQSGIVIPPDVKKVTVRAHDLVHGFGGSEVVVDLSVDSGTNYEVVRQ